MISWALRRNRGRVAAAVLAVVVALPANRGGRVADHTDASGRARHAGERI